ncbi:hypothetical protein G6O69_23670 [Pseudenhygromyxa sp. WMMC2535]|uniref:hypothetical protein n=1 Tax=Pseudenhygromyxa sp. WMMC2535 TaxID=2712867 RepID=UPI001595405E|nr:hypothetical protein [Pseudenhygromyxa sp. WMMC2535]NVB40858.1 hypothetical protein [Pseudenhygromyxa sp. WMMC2535]
MRSLPHRIASRRKAERRETRERTKRLRTLSDTDESGKPLLARRSMGFRTLTDMRRSAIEG